MEGNVLAIVGLALALVFGIFSIWAYRKSKKKTSLRFRKVQCYSLFKDDVARLNIEVSYNKQVLSNALILLKAQIINDGDNDIDKNQVVLISSKEFSWLEIKVITKQKYPKSAIKLINENEVQIEWDLLKSGELIEFEAIVKVSDKISEDGDEVADFLEGITFDHRIKDLKKVLIGDIPTRKRSDIVFACIIMALGVYIFIESFFPTTEFDASKHFIEYNICNDSASTTIGISIKDREEIALYYPMEEKEETLSIDDFNERFKINHIEKINKHNKEESPLSVRIFGLCFVLLGSWFLRKRK